MCPVLSKEALLNLLYWDVVVFVLCSQVNTRQTPYIVQGPAQKGLGTTCQQGLRGICIEPKVTDLPGDSRKTVLLSVVTSPDPRVPSEPSG